MLLKSQHISLLPIKVGINEHYVFFATEIKTPVLPQIGYCAESADEFVLSTKDVITMHDVSLQRMRHFFHLNIFPSSLFYLWSSYLIVKWITCKVYFWFLSCLHKCDARMV